MRYVRLLLAASTLAVPFTLAFAPTQAVAQQAPAQPMLCTGDVNIVRLSEIKPGMMQKFLDAVAAQKAWYKTTGTTDEVFAMRIMEQNPDTKASAFSETQAITTHIVHGNRKGPAHDAGYDAFVTMFKESSTIKNEYITCVVKM